MTVIDMDVKKRRKKKKASIQKYTVQKNSPGAGPAGGQKLSLVRPAGREPEETGLEKDKDTVKGKKAAAGTGRGRRTGNTAKLKERGTGRPEAVTEAERTEKAPKPPEENRRKELGNRRPERERTEEKNGRRSRRKKKKKKQPAGAGAGRGAAATGAHRRRAGKKKEEEYISGPFSFIHKERRQALLMDEPRLRWGKRRRGGIIALSILGCVLLAAAGTFFFILQHYHINKVYVEGNTHYTNEEIKQFVTGRRFGDNSLYLSYVYKQEDNQNIPFIEKMDVKVLSPDSIKITVYEKAVAGYVSYLDHYMYFDKDGIIVESVDEPTGKAPQVIGLDFDHVLLHEKLPVADDTIFAQILEVTQLMEKYEVQADKIYFNDNSEMTLYFGMARVALGKMTGIDEKIMKLKALLPELEGRRGVLQMENYTEETKLITFQQD